MSNTLSLQVLYGSSVDKNDFLRFLRGEGDKGNLQGTTTLIGGLGFTALNYSDSITLAQIIKWWTGIYPPILSRGSHVELVLKQIFGISKDVQNILLFYTPRTVISTDTDPL